MANNRTLSFCIDSLSMPYSLWHESTRKESCIRSPTLVFNWISFQNYVILLAYGIYEHWSGPSKKFIPAPRSACDSVSQLERSMIIRNVNFSGRKNSGFIQTLLAFMQYQRRPRHNTHIGCGGPRTRLMDCHGKLLPLFPPKGKKAPDENFCAN